MRKELSSEQFKNKYMRDKYTYLFISILSLSGIVLVTLAAHGQLLLTFDSYQFLQAADHFYHDGKIILDNHKPYINRSPLFPILLAALKGLSGNYLSSALVIHSITWGASILIIGITFYPLFQKKIFFWIMLGCIVLHPPLIMTHIFLWSEPVFFLLLSITIYHLLSYYKKNYTLNFIGLIIFSNLLCLQRYAGIFYVIGIGISLLLLSSESFQKRLYKSFMYTGCSLITSIAWFIRNFYYHGVFAGQQKSDGFFSVPLDHTLYLYMNSIFSWFLPHKIAFGIRAILLTTLLFLVLFFWIKKRPSLYQETTKVITSLLILFLCFFSLMFIFYSGIEDEIDRYLCTTYPLLVGPIFLLIANYHSYLKKIVYRNTIIISLLLWFIYPVIHTTKNIIFWHQLPKQPNTLWH